MPIISSIPKDYQEGFKELSMISDSDFEIIKDSLSKIPLALSIKQLVDKIVGRDSIEANLTEIFSSISSLISYIDNKEIIGELTEDIVRIGIEIGLIEKNKSQDLKIRLNYLLNNDSFFYASKANELSNYGNIYISSRIISDVRPIFNIESVDSPKAFLILHNLNFHYQSNDEPYHKDITLVLNTAELKELKEAIIRAERKDEVLRGILKTTDIISLNE